MNQTDINTKTEPSLDQLLTRFYRRAQKLRKSEQRLVSKPEKYSILNRSLRIGAALGCYTGFVALKQSAFPANGSLGYSLMGIGQIALLASGIQLAFLDRHRLNFLLQNKSKFNEAKWNLSRGVSRTSANLFFQKLLETNEDVFKPLRESTNLSSRQKKKIQKAFENIKDAISWFSNGIYTGSIDIDLLDSFKRQILDIEQLSYEKGMDLSGPRDEILKGLKKIRRDQVGDERDFIDTTATDASIIKSIGPAIEPQGSNRPNQATRAPGRSIEPPNRSIER